MSDNQVIQRFRERIASDNLSEGVKVVYQLIGGIPSQRVDVELVLEGDGEILAIKRDAPDTGTPPIEASAEIQPGETLELFQKVAEGIDSLMTRSESRFPPDSLVGAIIIDVDGEAATRYFLGDEKVRLYYDSTISPPMDHAVQQLNNLVQRLLAID